MPLSSSAATLRFWLVSLVGQRSSTTSSPIYVRSIHTIRLDRKPNSKVASGAYNQMLCNIMLAAYSGISLGWGWSRFPYTYGGLNNIVGNHIHHHMQVLGDGGAICTCHYRRTPTACSSIIDCVVWFAHVLKHRLDLVNRYSRRSRELAVRNANEV